MGVIGEVDKVESLINLPLVLRILGIIVLGITIWKGVHGPFITAAILIGALLLLAAGLFRARLEKLFAGLALLATAVACFVLALAVWKGVHGFFPTAGILVGGGMLLAGGMFNKIYK